MNTNNFNSLAYTNNTAMHCLYAAFPKRQRQVLTIVVT